MSEIKMPEVKMPEVNISDIKMFFIILPHISKIHFFLRTNRIEFGIIWNNQIFLIISNSSKLKMMRQSSTFSKPNHR